MVKTFKTEFIPTAKQKEYIHRACGIRRWTWNWAVATFFEAAKSGEFPSSYDLQKQLNNTLVLQEEYSWLSEVNSMVRGEALKDFGLAIKAYAKARQRAKRTVEKLPVDKYKPHFKKKGQCEESFRLFKKGGSEFKLHSAHDLSVVTVKGQPRMHIYPKESIAFLSDADIKTVTFSMKGGRYFVAVTYEKTNLTPRVKGVGKVGIDLGVKHAAVSFDGNASMTYDLPETLATAEKRIARCNRVFARPQKGSKRHEKLKQRLQRAHMHAANIRDDWQSKLTTHLVETYDTIVIDDFSFKGFVSMETVKTDGIRKHAVTKRGACRKLYSVAPYSFKLKLETKAAERGNTVVYVPKGTPTSRTCSQCGEKQIVSLNTRTFKCQHCGLVLDRDTNAAINVYNYC